MNVVAVPKVHGWRPVPVGVSIGVLVLLVCSSTVGVEFVKSLRWGQALASLGEVGCTFLPERVLIKVRMVGGEKLAKGIEVVTLCSVGCVSQLLEREGDASVGSLAFEGWMTDAVGSDMLKNVVRVG
jgi:hypothetical protein